MDWYLWNRLRRRRAPPRAVTDLKGLLRIVNKRKRHMSTETLTWTYPSKRTDAAATPIDPTDALRADIFDSLSPTPNVPIGSVMGNPGSRGSFTTPALPNGKNDFTVTITDGAVTSGPSNVFEVDVAPPPAPPTAVTDLAGTLNP